MSAAKIENRIKSCRLAKGWSQAELARRAGISRTEVSALEMNRLVPSVSAAISLAAAFDCRVENLFFSSAGGREEPAWAWPPVIEPCRYWHAKVADTTRLYPVESSPAYPSLHDGICRGGMLEPNGYRAAEDSLVLACCDPAAGLLAAEFARSSGYRLLVLARSSRQAMALVAQGLVHVAGVHLATSEEPEANVAAVDSTVSGGCALLRIADWQEGLTLQMGLGVRSLRSALRSKLSWVGREPGSGARECLDQLLEGRLRPRRLAFDHRGVAEAVRCGWADVGVCLRMVSEEAGLRFLNVRRETYELCYRTREERDPRIRSLIETVRSDRYRRLLGELPGFDNHETGAIRHVG